MLFIYLKKNKNKTKHLLAITIKLVAALTSCSIEEERLSAWVLDDHDRAVIVLKTTRDLGHPPL